MSKRTEAASRGIRAFRVGRPHSHLKGAHLSAIRRKLMELKGVEEALLDLSIATFTTREVADMARTLRGVRSRVIVLAEDLVRETRR